MAVKMVEMAEPTTLAEIEAVEKRLQIAIPDEYKAWLLKYNGGRPIPYGFDYKTKRGPYTDSMVAWFCAVGGRHTNFEVTFLRMKVDQLRLPDELMPIAVDPGGNLICIAYTGPKRGAIYFWDHEEEQDEPTYANCHLFADSLQEFIDGLHD